MSTDHSTDREAARTMAGPVFSRAPRRIYWEVTRACALACQHCRAEAAPEPDPEELGTAEGFRLIDQLAGFGVPLPHLVLTGGDPLARRDLFDLIALARCFGFGVSVAPSATPRLTADAIRRLRASGVEAISLSLDGSTAARHDALRGVPGCFRRTLEAARLAREAGLAFQINTLVSRETLDDLWAIHELVGTLDAARWSLFFLVSVGRGTTLQPVSAEECEALFVKLASLAGRGGPIITTTEAPHFRRVVLEGRRRDRDGSAVRGRAHAGAAATGIRDGNGIMFIDHTGLVCPSGFFPLPAGNARRESPVEIYRQSPLFRALRRPDLFGGRCGRCEYRAVCGGSRARAFAATGDPLGEDPLCAYQPGRRAVAAEALPPAPYQGRIAGAYSSMRSPTAMSGSIP